MTTVPTTPLEWLAALQDMIKLRPIKLVKMTDQRIAPLTRVSAHAGLVMLQLQRLGHDVVSNRQVEEHGYREMHESTTKLLCERNFIEEAPMPEDCVPGRRRKWWRLLPDAVTKLEALEPALAELCTRAARAADAKPSLTLGEG